jgi:hypothetical protein
MGENDMMKRELAIEGLKAEEARQAVRMTEARMEGLVAVYDAKLHEAAIKQAQLKRRERQVQDMKAQIEIEKKRAEEAVANERQWRDAMERTETE